MANEETMIETPAEPTMYEYTFILKGKRTYTTRAESEEQAKQHYEESIFNGSPIIDIIESEIAPPLPIDSGLIEHKSTRVNKEDSYESLEKKKAEFAKMFAEASKQKIDGATDNVAAEVVEKKTTKKKKSA